MSFELHSRLAADCSVVGDFELCRVLLLNDSRFPWIVLVPRIEDLTETFHLDEAEQIQLMRESNAVLERMSLHYLADKMNVAALGNMVPQLHIHHIARFRSDAAWPGPVWGCGTAAPYDEAALSRELKSLEALFEDLWVK